MPEKPTVLFYESNYFRFYGAAMAMLWAMQHMERLHPVFVAPGEGDVTRRVREAGIETVVIPTSSTWQRIEESKGKKAKIQKIAATPTLIPHIRQLAREARQRHAIGVLANSTRAAILAGPAARLAGVPMWWHLRRERPLKGPERLAFSMSDRVICVARSVKRSIGDPAKAVVIHDGIPLDRLDFDASGEQLKKRLGWRPDTLVVGMVASISPNKRHDLFVQMALRLNETHPQARFLLAGHRPAGVSPDYEERIRAMAKPLEDAGKLVFLGWVESMSEVYAAMDVLVHPSDNEGLGNVSIEAMLMGLPMVRTNSSGAEDLIIDGETGFIVPLGDVDAITNRVRRLLDDPELRQRMGEAGRLLAQEEFTARRMSQQMEELMLNRGRLSHT